MFAVGDNELGALIPAGARVKCGVCPKTHLVWYLGTLACYMCGPDTYLCGVAGRLLPGEELAEK